MPKMAAQPQQPANISAMANTRSSLVCVVPRRQRRSSAASDAGGTVGRPQPSGARGAAAHPGGDVPVADRGHGGHAVVDGEGVPSRRAVPRSGTQCSAASRLLPRRLPHDARAHLVVMSAQYSVHCQAASWPRHSRIRAAAASPERAAHACVK